MKWTLKLIFLLVISACLGPVDVRGADLFYYKDAQGALHFTNVPDDSRYRSVDTLKLEKSRKKPLSAGFSDFRNYIENAARKYEIDPLLIRALIKVESDYDPFAISNSGAQGLMQLMPGTSRQLAVTDPFNPEENIDGGARYFKRLLSLFDGQLIPSIAAYHAGENLVIKYDRQVPPIDATQRYVRKVISQYNLFHGIRADSSVVSRIYKIETEDGSVIFTNRPEDYRGMAKEVAYR